MVAATLAGAATALVSSVSVAVAVVAVVFGSVAVTFSAVSLPPEEIVIFTVMVLFSSLSPELDESLFASFALRISSSRRHSYLSIFGEKRNHKFLIGAV